MGELVPDKDTTSRIVEQLVTNSRCFGVVSLVNIEKDTTPYQEELMGVMCVMVATHMKQRDVHFWWDLPNSVCKILSRE